MNAWVRFLIGRVTGLLGVLVGLLVVTFLIMRLIPGDPARRIAGMDATQQQVEQVRESLGLNRPLTSQFLDYGGRALRLDFGRSYVTKEPVSKVIAARFPNTLRLAVTALLLVLLISIPLGIVMGALTREGRSKKLDLLFTAITGVAGSLPEYLAGTLLVLVFAVWLRWLPVAGAQKWSAVVLPALAIGLRPTAMLTRLVRLETLNVLAQDYVRTARSKRVSALRLYVWHVLPNVLTLSLTMGGLFLTSLLGGAVIVENVFAWPGLGTAIVQAVLVRDYPVVQGVVLLLGLMVALINTLVDMTVAASDPRSVMRSS